MRIKLIAKEKSLPEVKIRRVSFHGDTRTPLQFVNVMMPLNHVLRKCTAGYKHHESQEKTQLFDVHGKHKTCKTERELETQMQAGIYSDDIGMEFAKEKCMLLIIRSEKPQMTEDKIRTLREKKNLKILMNIGSGNHETRDDKGKIKKEYLRRNEKIT